MNPFDRDDATHLPSMEQLRQLMAVTAGPADASAACLDDDTVAALADGTLPPAARATALPHLAGCARCRRLVASVSHALNDRGVAREVASLSGRRRLLYRVALPLVAAAALVLLVSRPEPETQDFTHRSPTITAASAPALLAPVGRVAAAGELRWGAVAGADRYRVTLFDADGQVLYETEVTGTVAALPDSVAPVPGTRYLWKVEARIGFDRWSASDLIEFTVAGAAPPPSLPR